MSGPGPAPRPRGVMVDIGGRRLHLVRAGPRDSRARVLLEAGSFGFSVDWSVVQERLAARGVASIAYDRAGLGQSEPGPAPRDGLAVARDLEALLAAAGEEGPFIYVGHSMAGLHGYVFAGRNRGRLSGLVLVDAATPAVERDPAARRIAARYVRFAQAAAWAAAWGLLRPLSVLGDTIGLSAEAAALKRWAFAQAGHNRAAADEVAQWSTAARQAELAGPLDPALPVAVVTAGPPHRGERLRALMAQPARTSQRGYWVNVAGANHASLLGRRFADSLVEAIEQVAGAKTG